VRSVSAYATFDQVLNQAIEDFIRFGYDSASRLDTWLALLRLAAQHDPGVTAKDRIEGALRTVYGRVVDRGGLLRNHPGVARWTIDQLRPRLRAELDRRILASASLIKLNREEAVATTLRRFSGWVSSIPAGGPAEPQRRETKKAIRKATAQERYVLRRMQIDQGAKLAASLSEIVAVDAGAIAGIWRHHYSNNPREEHVDRDGETYLIRGSWADQRGLVRAGAAGYYDEVEPVAYLVYCRCTMEWLHALRRLPDAMLTDAGRAELARVRAALVG
jgi:hypothetical protein